MYSRRPLGHSRLVHGASLWASPRRRPRKVTRAFGKATWWSRETCILWATRGLPRYVRGKRGVIHRFLGVYVFPDAHAHGQGEQAEPLYSVRFEAAELWAESADGAGAVYVDLWESYLARESAV
jgi:hypothetical protein